jgi:hypothetical protein
MNWAYLAAWFAGGVVGTFVGTAFSRYLNRRREKLFLRFVSVTFKDSKRIEAISVSSRDKDAMANVERRLRDASRNL